MSAAERDQRIVKTGADLDALVQELEAEVEKNPANLDATLKLAKAQVAAPGLRPGRRPPGRRPRSASPTTPRSTTCSARPGVARLERRLDEARKASQPEDSIARLETELLKLQTDEARRRVAAHPTDLAARFRSAGCSSRPTRSIPRSSSSSRPSRTRGTASPASTCSARAFAKKGILDLAAKQFQEAAEAIHGMGEQKKQILYDLGLVHERQGQKDQALDVFKRIFENDIGFKDVGRKIDALQTG